jgi:AraC-like DNA-binding protein
VVPARASHLDGIVLVQSGAYRRRSDGVDHIVDTHTGCFRRIGEEVSIANFTGEPEEFTLVELSALVLEGLLASGALPNGPFSVTPEIDLAHRTLLTRLDHRDPDSTLERIIDLVGSIVLHRQPDVVRGSRPTTVSNWRRLVSDAIEVLHATAGDVSVRTLARRIGSSPFHLSRVFTAVTGSTISQYRMRMRVRAALNRLSHGDEDLAVVASAAGFFDHSHMTRCVVAQLGEPPSVLRQRLRREA